jgi:hypothetical protein
VPNRAGLADAGAGRGQFRCALSVLNALAVRDELIVGIRAKGVIGPSTRPDRVPHKASGSVEQKFPAKC